MKLDLLRTVSSDAGTFGNLSGMGLSMPIYTGEEPWRDNKPNESCIPDGTYQCAWTLSPRLGKFTYEVLNVPGRSGIRIHSANFVGDVSKGFKKELSGCIALGLSIGPLENQQAVLASRDAIAKFNEVMAGKPFELTISYL